MKRLISMSCYIFTVVLLLFTVLAKFDLAPSTDDNTALHVFIVAVSISAIMVICEMFKLNIMSIWADSLMRVLISFFVVFFEGVLFDWFPFSWEGILMMMPVFIPAFIVISLISYFTIRDYTEAINKAIKKRKEKKN